MAIVHAAEAEAPRAEVGWFDLSRGLDVATRSVFDDEPCWYLGEFNLPSKSGKTRCRYQLLRVVRDDRLVTAYVYLGPASKYKADQFQMIGGYVQNGRGCAVHTVAELRDGADELRSRPPMSQQVEPSDLQGVWREFVDQRERKRKAQSTYGPKGFVQRDN